MKYYCGQTGEPLRYYTSGTLLSPDGFLHNRRILDNAVFILIREGVLHMIQDGCPVDAGPGEFLFLYAGCEHRGASPSSGRLLYDWIHFSPPSEGKFLPKEQLPGPGSPSYVLPEKGTVPPGSRLPLLCSQVLEFSRKRDTSPPLLTDYSVSLLLMALTQQFWEGQSEQAGKIPPVVSSIMEWVRSHYHQPLTVPQIALQFGYHADYLSSLFHRTTGIPLVRFIQETRIEAAKNLLSEYGVSVREAALSCGFSDEKYFMRLFKKLEGITPMQFKKQ